LAKGTLRRACIGGWRVFGFPTREEQKVRILYYHSIGERVGDNYYLRIPPDTFREQMRLLSEEYDVISLRELVDRVKSGRKIKRSVLITFDDGFKDNYTVAYPILQEYDLPATFFVTTSFIGQKEYMNWNELKEMIENGFDIGSHTVTHPNLAKIRLPKIEEELRVSKMILEQKLEKEINLFAVPYGDSHSIMAEVIEVVKKYYDCCCLTQGYFGVSIGDMDLYQLKRTPVNYVPLSEFRSILEGREDLWLWLYEKLIVLKNEKLKLGGKNEDSTVEYN